MAPALSALSPLNEIHAWPFFKAGCASRTRRFAGCLSASKEIYSGQFLTHICSQGGRFPRVFGDEFGEEFGDKFGDDFSESLNSVMNLVENLATNLVIHQNW